MAMDEQVAEVVADVAAERQDAFDVRDPRQHDVGRGFDRVVEIQRGPTVRIEGPERRRFRPARVQNGQDVGDAAGAVAVELVKPANGQ